MSRSLLFLGVLLLAVLALLVTYLTRVERSGSREVFVQSSSPAQAPPVDLLTPSQVEPWASTKPQVGFPISAQRSALAAEPVAGKDGSARPDAPASVVVTVVLPLGIEATARPFDEVFVRWRFQGPHSLGVVDVARSERTTDDGAPEDHGTYVIERAPVGVELLLTVEQPFGPDWQGRVEPLVAGERRAVLVELEAGRAVSGQVVDERGEPVVGVRVSAEPSGRASLWLRPEPGPITDESGRFQLDPLAHGSWRIRVEGNFAQAEEIVIDARAGEVSELVLHVVRGLCLAGKVSWPDGSPAEGCEIVASGARHGRANTSSDGSFRVCALRPGAYDLEIDAKRENVLGRAKVSGVRAGAAALDIVLETMASFELTGVVTDTSGEMLSGFHVWWSNAAGQKSGWRDISLFPGRSGSFVLKGVPAGEIEVGVSADGYQTARQTVVVGSPAASSLSFALEPGHVVRGHVVDAADQPVSSAQVSVSEGGSTVSGADGSFALITGSARSTLHARKAGFAQSEGVVVEAGSAALVVLRLREPCRIEGHVLDAVGRPVGGVEVFAHLLPLGSSSIVPKVVTDAAGRFVVDDFPRGEAQVVALLDKAFARATVPTDPLRPAEVELRFPDSDPVHLRGRITRAGRPLACWLWLSGGGFETGRIDTDAGGAFELTLQRHGTWTGSIWLDGDEPDPEHGDERRFTLHVPDAESHEVTLEFDWLERVGPRAAGD